VLAPGDFDLVVVDLDELDDVGVVHLLGDERVRVPVLPDQRLDLLVLRAAHPLQDQRLEVLLQVRQLLLPLLVLEDLALEQHQALPALQLALLLDLGHLLQQEGVVRPLLAETALVLRPVRHVVVHLLAHLLLLLLLALHRHYLAARGSPDGGQLNELALLRRTNRL
jgi:hypothetical protein